MEQLNSSCEDAARFPRNIIYHNTYMHNLIRSMNRLSERERDLFSPDEHASLDIVECDTTPRKSQSTFKTNLKELREYIHGCASTLGSDPASRFVFLHAPNSRERLYTSRAMLTYILSYHQVMPAFLEFLFPYGRQEHARDLNFSGFREESRIDPAQMALNIPGLGRSGRELRMCYNLKSVEPSEYQPRMPWSIRQTAVYHSLDVETGKQFWVIIKGDELIKERIEDALEGSGGPKSPRPQNSVSDAFIATISTHMIICDWCNEDWRWYISFLEESLRQKTGHTLGVIAENPPQHVNQEKTPKTVTWSTTTSAPCPEKPISRTNSIMKSFLWTSTKPVSSPISDIGAFPARDISSGVYSGPVIQPPRLPSGPQPPPHPPQRSNTGYSEAPSPNPNAFSFTDLTEVQLVEDRANEGHYRWFINSHSCPQHLESDCVVEVERFEKRIWGIMSDLAMQKARTTTLLRLIGDRKSLLYGILQFQSMEASKSIAGRSQESTEHMEAMTKDMHVLALRTKQETVSMRIITLVTLFFLPGTFISTIMSTDIVQFHKGDSGRSEKTFHLDALQLFLEICLPMMFATFSAWYVVYWWIDRKEEIKRRNRLLEPV
ncbi:hypothetical protein BJ875DRAFT_217146 [Amylocarpus encephaloides]|uniref:CorA-like transporter domain-containing protein n=1 Tax=Amylocarpus encephaloides TaxID=45428 RepID=A0A9P8C080_9HELO|nr:hypothetical protein BJ875DRAFT_217146 [Amylocarpus encephaloides]